MLFVDDVFPLPIVHVEAVAGTWGVEINGFEGLLVGNIGFPSQNHGLSLKGPRFKVCGFLGGEVA